MLGRQPLGAKQKRSGHLDAAWVAELGAERVRALEDDIERIATSSGDARLGDLPGWLR